MDISAIQREHELKRIQLRCIDAELAMQPMSREPEDNGDIFEHVIARYSGYRQAYIDELTRELTVFNKARDNLCASEDILENLKKRVPSYRRIAAVYERLGMKGLFSQHSVEEMQHDRIASELDLRAQEEIVDQLKIKIRESEHRIAQISDNFRNKLLSERIKIEQELRKLREQKDRIEQKKTTERYQHHPYFSPRTEHKIAKDNLGEKN